MSVRHFGVPDKAGRMRPFLRRQISENVIERQVLEQFFVDNYFSGISAVLCTFGHIIFPHEHTMAHPCLMWRVSEAAVVPAIPQSEVLARLLQEVAEKCCKILAKWFADFRPSIFRGNRRNKNHKKSSTFSTAHQIKFFHCCNSGGWRVGGIVLCCCFKLRQDAVERSGDSKTLIKFFHHRAQRQPDTNK